MQLEACVEAQPEHNRGVHVGEPRSRRIQRPFECLIDDLQVERRAEPVGDLGIVIQLDGVLMAEAQPELLAQERHEVATELCARPADPAGRTAARPETLGTDPNVVRVLDGVRYTIGGAKPEEDADPVSARPRGSRGTGQL